MSQRNENCTPETPCKCCIAYGELCMALGPIQPIPPALFERAARLREMAEENRRTASPAEGRMGEVKRPDSDWYRRNIMREPDDVMAGAATNAQATGWALVPIEPTSEMLRDGALTEPPDCEWGQNYIGLEGAKQCWDAMLKAAPKPSPADSPATLGEDAVEALIDEIEGFANAYPVDVFGEITAEERALHGHVIQKAAAAMGRKMGERFLPKALALRTLAKKPEGRAVDDDVVRGQFEYWAAPQGLRLHRRDRKGSTRLGQYCSDETQLAFEAFRAAYTTPAAEQGEGVK